MSSRFEQDFQSVFVAPAKPVDAKAHYLGMVEELKAEQLKALTASLNNSYPDTTASQLIAAFEYTNNQIVFADVRATIEALLGSQGELSMDNKINEFLAATCCCLITVGGAWIYLILFVDSL